MSSGSWHAGLEIADSTPLHVAEDLPAPPRYDFSEPRSCELHVGSTCVRDTQQGDFYRFAKWCPDGSAALAITESRVCRVFATRNLSSFDTSGISISWPAIWEAPQPSAIWSNAWYPYASLSNPATFCYVSGIADAPVRLVDGKTGKTRASYPIVNHSERFIAPSSLCFNGDASRLYCGFDSAIEVFEFNRPGSSGTRLKTSPTRKSRDGQKGMISALTFAPDGSGTFAAGSYSGNISIYSEDSGEDRLAEIVMGEPSSGITQLTFHPTNGYVLWAASRMSDHIAGYDMRNLNGGPFIRLHRPGRTQQRMTFDVDWAGRYLTTGGTDGVIRVYDVDVGGSSEAISQVQAHQDVIGSISMHPFEPIWLTAFGSRLGTQTGRLHTRSTNESSSDSDSEPGSTASDSSASCHSDAALRAPSLGLIRLSS
ncbi:hypothetical protein FFLO_02810 [Filobasidium floriforme]|uniref:WD40 repeat-like protein n=1 Tax=Filobasidium floriforme TaxID=5210 RepID=A0A8K0JLY4_9TREE|nr:WD40-repeat-containing domain protein [Filobasidium floriforme]KAG7558247.1 hypothetical protein FFLO_02810 [Filobasidium floriforme]KAH8080470.1 WD40-repeat-containing domain protein [Filobasidium floriforme]